MFGENYASVPFDQQESDNAFLRVTNIKIMLNTNILDMKPTPLTFDMLYHHDLEKGRYPTAQYSLPFFTDSVRYPLDYLTSKTYSERVDFFFNKKRFNTMCRTFGTNYIDYGEEDNEGNNSASLSSASLSSASSPGAGPPGAGPPGGPSALLSNTGSTKLAPANKRVTYKPKKGDATRRLVRPGVIPKNKRVTQTEIDEEIEKYEEESNISPLRRSRSVSSITPSGVITRSKAQQLSRQNSFGGGAIQDPDIIAKQERDNADHNVKCMLILLLPIADEFVNVFQTSYDQYILNKPSPELYTLRNIDPTMLLNPTWLPFYNYFSTRKYEPPIQEISYIKQGDAKYAVTSVVWLNDIVNHPIYREFLTSFYEKSLEKKNNRPRNKTQLKERLTMFRALIQRNQTTGDEKMDLFTKLFQTLLENVNIVLKGKKTPSEQIQELLGKLNSATGPDSVFLNISKTVTAVTNPKDAAKRDSVIKIAMSFSKIILINKKLQPDGNLEVTEWFSMIDNIVSAYIEYSLYNESADKGMQINLKDEARILTELYNQAVFIKALRLLDDFLYNRISRFDMNEKNVDGTPKPKLELDIIRIIRENFPYYIKLNDSIVKPLRNVLEPTRRSSNPDLQQFLKNMFNPSNMTKKSTGDMSDDKYAILEIYNKYIANTRKHIHHGFTERFMYTGVSTVVENEGASSNTNTPTTPETPGVVPKPVGGDDQQSSNSSSSSYREIPEIYVYVNVVQKEEYEGSENRMCIMSDDMIANNLKRVLFTNTMMDDSFPEVNPYRVYRFLKGSETKTPFNVDKANKSIPQTPAQNVTQGGTKRVARNTYKYLSNRFPVKNTRKYRKH